MITKHTCMHIVFPSVLVAISVSCSASNSTNKTPVRPAYKCTNTESVIPTLPISAKKCLREKLGIRDVESIAELTYTSGRKTYLGIDGTFSLTNGTSLHYAFVLSIANDDGSWENAKIYRAEPLLLSYESNSGEQINVGVDAVRSITILPENILTNYLWEISSIEESVWTKDAYDEWCRRMSRVTIHSTKNIITRGAEGGSSSNSSGKGGE